jgi:hypothetical protein
MLLVGGAASHAPDAHQQHRHRLMLSVTGASASNATQAVDPAKLKAAIARFKKLVASPSPCVKGRSSLC